MTGPSPGDPREPASGADPRRERSPAAWHGLCDACDHLRRVTSARGSTFLLCERSASDSRYPKYPPQPVLRCAGFERTVPEPP